MKKIIIGVVIGAVSLFGLFKIGEYVHRKTVAGSLVKEEKPEEDNDFITEPDTDFLDEDIESEEWVQTGDLEKSESLLLYVKGD